MMRENFTKENTAIASSSRSLHYSEEIVFGFNWRRMKGNFVPETSKLELEEGTSRSVKFVKLAVILNFESATNVC